MNDYKVLSTFETCGNTYVTVIINGNACVLDKVEYDKIIDNEHKYIQKFWLAA